MHVIRKYSQVIASVGKPFASILNAFSRTFPKNRNPFALFVMDSQAFATFYLQKMLANPYECLTITTNALPSIRIYCDAYENNKNNAFLSNFRTRFLIFATPDEIPRMLTNIYECLAITLLSWRSLCDHCELMANGIRKPIRHTFATGETSITFETPQKRPRMLTNSYECLAIICDLYEFMANCIRMPIRHIFGTV